MVLGSYSAPQQLVYSDGGRPLSEQNIDKVWRDQRVLLQQHASSNLQAQKNHKLNQPTEKSE
mgnify:FL=1